MMRINFLPYRKSRDLSLRNSFYVKLIGSVMCGCMFGALATFVISSKLLDQSRVSDLLKSEITLLEPNLSRVADVSRELALLENRKRTIVGLYADRNETVRLLGYLASFTPDGVVFSGIDSRDGKIFLDGFSETTERVGVLIANLSSRNDFFQNIELIDVKADSLAGKAVFRFSVAMKVDQKLM